MLYASTSISWAGRRIRHLNLRNQQSRGWIASCACDAPCPSLWALRRSLPRDGDPTWTTADEVEGDGEQTPLLPTSVTIEGAASESRLCFYRFWHERWGRHIVSPGVHAHCTLKGKDTCHQGSAGYAGPDTRWLRNSKILRFAAIRRPIIAHGWMFLPRSLSCSLFTLYRPTERPCQSRQRETRDETVYFDDYVTTFYDDTNVANAKNCIVLASAVWSVLMRRYINRVEDVNFEGYMCLMPRSDPDRVMRAYVQHQSEIVTEGIDSADITTYPEAVASPPPRSASRFAPKRAKRKHQRH